MTVLHRGEEKCSNCGLEIAKMQEEENEKQEALQAEIEKKTEEAIQAIKVGDVDAQAQDDSRKFESDNQDIENKEEQVVEEKTPEETEVVPVVRKRHKHKPKKVRIEDRPQYKVEEDGTYSIDTSDVSFLEDIDTKSYSVKKARGDAPAVEKLKWWEIYKWADRVLARRKINKEVKKASYKLPYAINKTKMILWCIFFGWLGIHNFYGGNKKKGWTIVAFDIVVMLTINIPVLYEFMGIFVGGGLGFVVVAMWLKDLFNLIVNRYCYRISKEEFISNLNLETRAKLGNKYITFDRKAFKDKEEKRLRKYLKRLNKKKLKQEKKANGKK